MSRREWDIRMVGDELPAVISQWVDSYRSSHSAGMISMRRWPEVMRQAVLDVLERPGVETWCAVMPGEEDPEVALLGWLCLERGVSLPMRQRRRGGDGRLEWCEVMQPIAEPLVHYIFVGQAYRRMGIARSLFEAAGVDPLSPFPHTCKTSMSSSIGRVKCPNASWWPLVARFPKT